MKKFLSRCLFVMFCFLLFAGISAAETKQSALFQGEGVVQAMERLHCNLSFAPQVIKKSGLSGRNLRKLPIGTQLELSNAACKSLQALASTFCICRKKFFNRQSFANRKKIGFNTVDTDTSTYGTVTAFAGKLAASASAKLCLGINPQNGILFCVACVSGLWFRNILVPAKNFTKAHSKAKESNLW